MYRRKRNRVKMVLGVHALGQDKGGVPFDELTYTLDIGANGVRLGGMEGVMLELGDVVEIRRRHKRAQYCVMWVGEPGTQRTGHVGLRGISIPENFWGIELPVEGEQATLLPKRLTVSEERAG